MAFIKKDKLVGFSFSGAVSTVSAVYFYVSSSWHFDVFTTHQNDMDSIRATKQNKIWIEMKSEQKKIGKNRRQFDN